MTVAGIKADIVTQLKTISSLKRVYDHLPEEVNKIPCAMVLPKSATYETLAGRTVNHTLEVTLLVKRVGDLVEGQEDLDSYLDDSTGANSICHWIEQSTNYSMRVVGFRDYGGFTYGNGQFIGCKFDVICLD